MTTGHIFTYDRDEFDMSCWPLFGSPNYVAKQVFMLFADVVRFCIVQEKDGNYSFCAPFMVFDDKQKNEILSKFKAESEVVFFSCRFVDLEHERKITLGIG